jgi:NAD(P)-dependent dehydrogenase (short-subunit alcohol dehydrogenase family)
MKLQGSVAIVTGAGSGIGSGIAERFAEEDAAVVIAELDEQAGSAVERHLLDQGKQALFVKTDVSKQGDIQRLFEQVVRVFGRVDTMVNNAGVNFVKPFGETTLEDWEHVIGVDLRGTFLGCKYAIERFLRQGGGGNIVNISSVHSVSTLPYAAPYAAAKGGVTQMTQSLAIEFGRQGIRVNSVCPGLTDTRIWQDLKASGPGAMSVVEHWMGNIALGREASPREIANMVVWLASDEASYVTGANLLVDGGMTAMLTNRERGG